MKTRLDNAIHWIIKGCFLLLGLSVGCSETNGPDMYGTPQAEFAIKGKVVDKDTNKEIPGISVSLDKPSPLWPTIVYTSQDGSFSFEGSSIGQQENFTITLNDVDGELNGLYSDKTEAITFSKSDYKGGDGWYQGKAEKTGVVFKMDKTPQ